MSDRPSLLPAAVYFFVFFLLFTVKIISINVYFRSNIVGANVHYSPTLDSDVEAAAGEGLDMALMALCNHTIISHGECQSIITPVWESVLTWLSVITQSSLMVSFIAPNLFC